MKSNPAISRRNFLQLVALGTFATLISTTQSQQPTKTSLPLITLGGIIRTTPIVLGGWALGEILSQTQAIELVSYAFDRGITFFDTAPTYGKHSKAEKRLGQALEGKRNRVTISSKTFFRDAKQANEDLNGSLQRLNTSYLDIWMFHEVRTQEEVEEITDKGGALEAARQAVTDGKVRLIGASGHHSPAVLNTLMEKIPELSVLQFPVNCLDPHQNSFMMQTLPLALERKISVIGTAPLARGMISHVGTVTNEQAIAFALSQPLTAWCPTISSKQQLDDFIDAYTGMERLSLEDQEKIMTETKPFSGIAYEHYKNWNR